MCFDILGFLPLDVQLNHNTLILYSCTFITLILGCLYWILSFIILSCIWKLKLFKSVEWTEYSSVKFFTKICTAVIVIISLFTHTGVGLVVHHKYFCGDMLHLFDMVLTTEYFILCHLKKFCYLHNIRSLFILCRCLDLELPSCGPGWNVSCSAVTTIIKKLLICFCTYCNAVNLFYYDTQHINSYWLFLSFS